MNFKNIFTLITLMTLLNLRCFASTFDPFFPRLIHSEGLYFVLVQYDKGRETKFGITFMTYQTWCNQTKVIWLSCDKDKNGKLEVNDLRITTLMDVKPIYRVRYWDFHRLSEIQNQAIAENIADMIINCGTGTNHRHIKAIQKHLGIKQDGVIGTNTIRAINKSKPTELYTFIFNYRQQYYKRIGVGRQHKFLKGWLNRITTLKNSHIHEKYIAY